AATLVGLFDDLQRQVAPERAELLGGFAGIGTQPLTRFYQFVEYALQHLRMRLGERGAGQVIALVIGKAGAIGQRARRQLLLVLLRKGSQATQASTLRFSKAARPSAGAR